MVNRKNLLFIYFHTGSCFFTLFSLVFSTGPWTISFSIYLTLLLLFQITHPIHPSWHHQEPLALHMLFADVPFSFLSSVTVTACNFLLSMILSSGLLHVCLFPFHSSCENHSQNHLSSILITGYISEIQFPHP